MMCVFPKAIMQCQFSGKSPPLDKINGKCLTWTWYFSIRNAIHPDVFKTRGNTILKLQGLNNNINHVNKFAGLHTYITKQLTI